MPDASKQWRARWWLAGIAIALGWYYRDPLFELFVPETTALVTCNGQEGGVLACTVEHRSGAAAHVCWDVTVACRNGVRPRAGACLDVEPTQKAMRMLSEKDLDPPATECDGVESISVSKVDVSTVAR